MSNRREMLRHFRTLALLLGKPFQEAAEAIQLERVQPVKEAAGIEAVYDRKSGTTNDKLTPGHSVKITGTQLKIHNSPAGQGLFFVSQADGSERPVTLEDNFPSQLRADIPDDLPAGTYRLKIVNVKYSTAATLRTAFSEMVLTVD